VEQDIHLPRDKMSSDCQPDERHLAQRFLHGISYPVIAPLNAEFEQKYGRLVDELHP